MNKESNHKINQTDATESTGDEIEPTLTGLHRQVLTDYREYVILTKCTGGDITYYEVKNANGECLITYSAQLGFAHFIVALMEELRFEYFDGESLFDSIPELADGIGESLVKFSEKLETIVTEFASNLPRY